MTWIAEEYPALLGSLPAALPSRPTADQRPQRLLLTINEAAE